MEEEFRSEFRALRESGKWRYTLGKRKMLNCEMEGGMKRRNSERNRA